MKIFKISLVVLMLCSIILCGKAYSTVGRVCNATCNQDKSDCKGGALMGSNGKLSGCTKSGTGCTGTCYTCESGASNWFCESSTGSDCLTIANPPSVSCGGRIPGTCGGTWSSGCTCTAGTGSPSGSCDPVQCEG